MTTTQAAKAATSKTTAKVSHAKVKATPARELPSISSVKLVPLTLIDIRPQVRTIFDEESIHELAEDIQARGLLQPVLLNPNGDRFTLIAGERRVRACNLAGLTDIPALITKASEADALLMQLAENVQRENLDLQDEVNAIRLLHDHLKTVAAVADTIKKSPAWVSKRLALSHPDMHWQAQALIRDAITEDVEILNGVSQLFDISYYHGNQAVDAVRAKTATRDSIRQAVKIAKDELKKSDGPSADPAIQAQRKADREAENERARLAEEQRMLRRKEGTDAEFVEYALNVLKTHCAEPDPQAKQNATDYLNNLHAKQRQALLGHLEAVQAKAKAWTFTELAFAFTPWDSDYNYIEQFVIILALKNQPVDLYSMVTILEAANMFKEDDA